MLLFRIGTVKNSKRRLVASRKHQISKKRSKLKQAHEIAMLPMLQGVSERSGNSEEALREGKVTKEEFDRLRKNIADV
jgi:hypothetical protein